MSLHPTAYGLTLVRLQLPSLGEIGGPRSEPEKISNAAPERIPQIENLFIHPLGGY